MRPVFKARGAFGRRGHRLIQQIAASYKTGIELEEMIPSMMNPSTP